VWGFLVVVVRASDWRCVVVLCLLTCLEVGGMDEKKQRGF
jgi:hypothetical protein